MIRTETGLFAARSLTLSTLLSLSAALVAFALGFAAQSALDKGDELALALLFFVLAAALFSFSVWNIRIERVAQAEVEAPSAGISLPLTSLSFALAALAFVESSGNEFRPIGVVSWFASILVFVLAMGGAQTTSSIWARRYGLASASGIFVRWDLLAVVGITAIGAFYRFYKLDAILAEMGPDLPLKYGNVQDILQGNYLIFFPSHPGREALFFYWAAFFAKIFGNSHLAIKFAAALIGTLTIPVFYVTVKRIFNAEVGLYAALLLAISHWHVILSRIGFRAILMPLFVLILIYLTLRALERRRDFDFAVTGLWLGLGFYTYNAWLLAPMGLVVALAAYWLAHRNIEIRTLTRFLVIAGIAAFLVWVPLLRYAYENPEMYFKRVATRITSEEQPLPSNLVGVFLDNVWRTLTMLNYRGDSVYIQNVPFMRELGFVTGVLFILGLGYVLGHWRRGANSIVLSFFFIMLMPSALSVAFPQEVPNDVRSSGGIGMAIIISAIPLSLLRAQVAQLLPRLRAGPFNARVPISAREAVRIKGQINLSTAWIVPALALVLLWGEARDTFKTFFVDYVKAQPSQNYSISLELARALVDFDGNGPGFVKIWPYWYDGNALRVQMGAMAKDWNGELDHFDANQPPFIDFQGKALFLVDPQDTQALEFLRNFFPAGIEVEYSDTTGQVQFISFYAQK